MCLTFYRGVQRGVPSEKAVVLFKSEYLNSGAGADSDDELPFKCAIAYPNLDPVPVLLEIANEVQKQ